MTTVSVILPTYNEADSILHVVSSVRQALAGHGYDHEVIVIDDASSDGTVDRLQQVYHGTDAVQWYVRHGQRGLASAVVTGMRRAVGDVYVVMDADLQHPPERVINLAFHIEIGAELAVGSRFADGGGVADDWPIHRRLISRGADLLGRVAVPRARSLTDPLSGFFAVRADCVDPEALRPTGYKILLELLARCPLGRIHEVPYTFERREHGASNLGPREYVAYLWHLARLSIAARVGSPASPAEQPAATDGGHRRG